MLGYLACFIAAGCVLVMIALDGRYRRRKSRMRRCAAIVVLSAMGLALTMLGRGDAWRRLLDDDPGGWGVIGILMGTALFAQAMLHRPRRAGACGSCGYDLRGNVSGVCPECGSNVVAENSKSTPSPDGRGKNTKASARWGSPSTARSNVARLRRQRRTCT